MAGWTDIDGLARRRRLLLGASLILAGAIFTFDLLSPFDGAVAVLYIVIVLLLAPLGRGMVAAAGAITALLAVAAFWGGHITGPSGGAWSRLVVSLVAIGATTALSLRDRSIRTTLGEQARILELSHDTVIIRDRNDVIVHWNEGAEQLYGWRRDEAVGRPCQDLLRSVFPTEEVEAALARDGQWSGELIRTRRDGARLVLASRWLVRRDPEGRSVGVIESSADLTEQRRADRQRQASEERYRTMFDAAGFAAWESDWSQTLRVVRSAAPEALAGSEALEAWLANRPETVRAAIGVAVLRTANPAAARLLGAPSPAVLCGMSIGDRFPAESLEACGRLLGGLAAGRPGAEVETRLETLDGRLVDVVLRLTLLPTAQGEANVLAMAMDVTEQNAARARLEEASAELAHAARVATLGQLAASIAHEVNQPLTAIINFARSGKRWLDRTEPDLAEADACLDRIIANGARAAEVIGRVRAMVRKTAPQAEPLDLAALAEETIVLVQREARAAGAAIHRRWRDDAPMALGDRVQVQQVLLNLMLNAVQALRETQERRREVTVTLDATPEGQAELAVKDTGPGFPNGAEDRIFRPFFTTKPDGMGMGLSICRSIIEAQGGRITATNNPDGPGACVAFTLPPVGQTARRAAELIS